MENETNPNTEKASSINTLLCAGRSGSKPDSELNDDEILEKIRWQKEHPLSDEEYANKLRTEISPDATYTCFSAGTKMTGSEFIDFLVKSRRWSRDQLREFYAKKAQPQPITNHKYLSITSQLQDLETQVNKLIEKFEEPHKLESGSKGVTVVLKQKQETWDKTIELGVIIDAKIL